MATILDLTTGVVYLKGGITGPVTIVGTLTLTPAAVTGSATTSSETLAQTWNTSGNVVGVKWTFTDTASGSSSLPFQILGGAAGSTNLFNVDKIGAQTIAGGITVGSGSAIRSGARGFLAATGDGVWKLSNNLDTGATTFSIGPTTGNTASGTTSISHVVTTLNMATATGTGTGTITSPNTALPANSLILGITARVTTILAGAALGTWSLGDGTDADRWGTTLAVAAGTLVNVANFTTASPAYQAAAGTLVMTASAGVFSTGVISFTTHYITFTPIGV